MSNCVSDKDAFEVLKLLIKTSKELCEQGCDSDVLNEAMELLASKIVINCPHAMDNKDIPVGEHTGTNGRFKFKLRVKTTENKTLSGLEMAFSECEIIKDYDKERFNIKFYKLTVGEAKKLISMKRCGCILILNDDPYEEYIITRFETNFDGLAEITISLA